MLEALYSTRIRACGHESGAVSAEVDVGGVCGAVSDRSQELSGTVHGSLAGGVSLSLLCQARALAVSTGPAGVLPVLASCGRRGTQTIEKTRQWKTPAATAKLLSFIT